MEFLSLVGGSLIFGLIIGVIVYFEERKKLGETAAIAAGAVVTAVIGLITLIFSITG